MIEKVCNLWLEPAEYRCIPTTGQTTSAGEAVMTTGIPLEVARKYSGIETDLGRLIASLGNHVHVIRQGLVSFPTTQYAWAGPSLQLIQRSARELIELVGGAKTLLPRPGCGPGELEWARVAEVLSILPDNIIVIQHK